MKSAINNSDAVIQRTKALALANERRIAKAALKRQIRAGEVDAVAVVLETELPIEVSELLMCLPRIGVSKAKPIVKELGVDARRRIPTMPPLMRKRLAVAVGQYLESRRERTTQGGEVAA